jgi:hypothetical protein
MGEITPTMQQMLNLIGISAPSDLLAEKNTRPDNGPLRLVNDILVAALREVEHGERAMRREIKSLKDAADREIILLDQGYATTDWPTHYAGKVETGRQQILRGAEMVTALAVLRRSLLP